jgi:hypothetical protein
MKLSHYPKVKTIDGKIYKRSGGGLHSTKTEAEKEKKSLSETVQLCTAFTFPAIFQSVASVHQY